MSAQQFVTAVEREEIASLVKLPGVGKKTAERYNPALPAPQLLQPRRHCYPAVPTVWSG
jgi:hypothetical protein